MRACLAGLAAGYDCYFRLPALLHFSAADRAQSRPAPAGGAPRRCARSAARRIPVQMNRMRSRFQRLRMSFSENRYLIFRDLR
jgi:hypothetical protein